VNVIKKTNPEFVEILSGKGRIEVQQRMGSDMIVRPTSNGNIKVFDVVVN